MDQDEVEKLVRKFGIREVANSKVERIMTHRLDKISLFFIPTERFTMYVRDKDKDLLRWYDNIINFIRFNGFIPDLVLFKDVKNINSVKIEIIHDLERERFLIDEELAS